MSSRYLRSSDLDQFPADVASEDAATRADATSGRVPLTGHFPRISVMNDPRTVIGPLARTVADLGLALAVIQGVDGVDASVVPMPLGDWRTVDLRPLRVAFYTEHEEATPDPVCKQATLDVAKAFTSEVDVVEERLPPRLGETYAITRDYWRRPESASRRASCARRDPSAEACT